MGSTSIGSRKLAPQIGANVEQLREWVRAGYVVPIHRGKGNPLEWPASELAVATLMVRLMSAGMLAGHAAAVARTAVLFEQTHVEIAPGLTLHIDA